MQCKLWLLKYNESNEEKEMKTENVMKYSQKTINTMKESQSIFNIRKLVIL
jgi:hypothetical protein